MAINAAFDFVLLGTDVNTRNYSHLKAKEMLGPAKTMSLPLWVGWRNIMRDIQNTDRGDLDQCLEVGRCCRKYFSVPVRGLRHSLDLFHP
jgi:hypothetical protein